MDTRRRATYVENKPDMAGQRGPLAACWRLIGRSWPKLGACSGAQRSHRSASWPKAEPARLRHGVPRWSWRAGVPPRPATCYGRLVTHSLRGRASWRATHHRSQFLVIGYRRCFKPRRCGERRPAGTSPRPQSEHAGSRARKQREREMRAALEVASIPFEAEQQAFASDESSSSR